MKIDLHCHTKSIKKGDPVSRNASIDLIVDKIKEAKVEIVAITNHNHFDINQFKDISTKLKETVQIWPGIELDCVCNENNFHCIVIGDPTKLEEFDRFVKTLKIIDVNNFKIDVDKLISLSENLNCIYTLHYHNKDPFISEDNFEYFKSKVKNPKRLLVEVKNEKSCRILRDNLYNAIWGSDVTDWNNYEQYEIYDSAFKFASFNKFICFIENNILSEQADYYQVEKIEVYGDSETKSNPFNINIYPGINIIFGSRGSGKTEALKSLSNYFNVNKRKNIYFDLKQNSCEKMLRISDDEHALSNFNLTDDFGGLFIKLKSFAIPNPTSIRNYKNWLESETANTNRKKFKSIDLSPILNNNNKTLEQIKEDLNILNSFLKKINKPEIFCQFNEEKTKIINFIKEFIKKVQIKKVNEWIKFNATSLYNKYISNMRNYVSECIGSSPKPIGTGFISYFNEIKKFNQICKKINSVLNQEPVIKKKLIGVLQDKGQVYLESKYSFKLEDVVKGHIISTKREIKTLLSSFKEISDKKIETDMNLLKNLSSELNKNQVNDIIWFSVIKKNFTINNTPYTLSSGENAILSLQQIIDNKEYDCYCFDELETGLSNKYISNCIVPKLNDLSRLRKKVILTTHNANIAVLTIPINTIFKTCENEVYTTYEGNLYSDNLINICNIDDIKSWKEVSEIYLEGGKEAFKQRGEKYE